MTEFDISDSKTSGSTTRVLIVCWLDDWLG